MGALGIKPLFSVKKAHETQLRLSKQIIFEDTLPEKIGSLLALMLLMREECLSAP